MLDLTAVDVHNREWDKTVVNVMSTCAWDLKQGLTASY